MKLQKKETKQKDYSFVQLYVGEGCSASASVRVNGNCGCNGIC